MSLYQGECSTAYATSAKEVNITGYVLETDALVAVKFTAEVTGTLTSPTLNVTSTGAKSIVWDETELEFTPGGNILYLFQYNGTSYEVVGYNNEDSGGSGGSYNNLSDKPQIAGITLVGNKTLASLGIASDQHFWTDTNGAHITEDTQEDYLDNPSAAGGNTLITSDGMSIRKGTTALASFESTGAQVGKTNGSHVRINPTGTDFYNDDGLPIATIGRASSTNRTITVGEAVYDSSDEWSTKTLTAKIAYAPINNQITLIFGATRYRQSESDYISQTVSYTAGTSTYTLQSPGGGSFGCTVTVVINTNLDTVTYTFADTTGNANLVGAQGFVQYTHVWNPPHYGFGDLSVAETYGECAVAMNATEAQGDFQTTVGKYNEPDEDGWYAFIVGNGTDEANPNNAFWVDWEGSAYAQFFYSIDGAYLGDIDSGGGLADDSLLSVATQAKWRAILN